MADGNHIENEKSFVVLTFQIGVEYHNSDFKRFIGYIVYKLGELQSSNSRVKEG